MMRQVVGATPSPSSADSPPDENVTLADVAEVARTIRPDGAPVTPSPSQHRRKTRQSRVEDATTVWAWVGHDFDDGISDLADAAVMPKAHLVALLRAESLRDAEEGKGNAVKRYWLEGVLTLAVLAGIGLFIVTSHSDHSYKLTGLRGAVTRSFVGPDALAFSVAEFDTEAQAEAGMQVLAERLVAEPQGPGTLDFSQLEVIGAPAMRDGVKAYSGDVSLGGITADVSFLFVHDGRYVHVMQSLSTHGAPIAPVSLAEQLFGPGPYIGLAATPAATSSADKRPGTSGLWDRLPRLEQLPSGYTVADETESLNAALLPIPE
jgi:hypothetical protein